MHPSVMRKRSSRHALLGVLALGVALLCGIGIGSAAGAPRRAQPALAHPLGLVAPLSRLNHPGAHAPRASVGLRRAVKVVGRSLKARLMASALQDPKVTVGTQ